MHHGASELPSDTPRRRPLARRAVEIRYFSLPRRSGQAITLRAVSKSRSNGIPRVFRIRLDRFDDQVELMGAVDLSRDAIDGVVCDELGFGEVVQPIDPAGGMVLHDEDDTGAVFRPGEQKEMIGAEVEHGIWKRTEAGGVTPAPLSAPLRGWPADSSKRVIAQRGA